MPVELSRLREICPGPTLGEVLAHPDRYPEEMARLRALVEKVAQLQEGLKAIINSHLGPAVIPFGNSLEAGLKAIINSHLGPAVIPFGNSLEAGLKAIINSHLGPGTFWGDLLLAREGDEAALIRLAHSVPWEPKHPAARRALAKLADIADPEKAWREALLVGFYWALQRDQEPQRIRVGREYLWDENGKRWFRPEELPLELYFSWLRKEVINEAEAYLLGEAGPTKSGPLTVLAAEKDLPPTPSPEELVLLREAETERRRELERVLAQATPQQQKILLTALEVGPDWAAVARRLGLSPSTVRAQMALLRRRLKRWVAKSRGNKGG